jgi:hypothetical protein
MTSASSTTGPLPPSLLLPLLLAAGGCEEVSPGPDAAAATDEEPQGAEASSVLAVNEVAPRGGPDWIELVNRSAEPVDLCGYFVTDALDRLDKYHPLGGAAPPDPCAPVMLEPGGYHVVVADGRPELGPDHAPFRLGPAEEVHVVTVTGRVEDSLVYFYPATAGGRTLARIPDGDARFFLAEPTPGAPNPEAP